MTQITTPPSPYKIIVPRTSLSGLSSVVLDLSSLVVNTIQFRLGLRSLGAITGGTQINFTPRTTLIADCNYHITQYTGVGVPVLSVVDNIGNNVIPIQFVAGTDAAASDLMTCIFTCYNWNSADSKTVLGSSVFMPNGAIKRTNSDFYVNNTGVTPYNGMTLSVVGGANFGTQSWYEIAQLD